MRRFRVSSRGEQVNGTPPLIGGFEVNSLSELLSTTRFDPRCKERATQKPSQSHLIIVAGHSPYEERLLILRIDDPKFFDCRFQRRCLIGCFDYTDERAGRSLDGAINFPLGQLLGHGRAVAVDLLSTAHSKRA
jgi:hypothetical protein